MHRPWQHSVAGVACGLLGLVLVGCGGNATPTATEAESASARRTYWTVRQAEAIAVVRGQPVHVRQCRGLGSANQRHGVRLYARFACTAGTGLEWETFDSVSVTYVLVPLGPWRGTCSAHVMRRVHFVGAGIP